MTQTQFKTTHAYPETTYDVPLAREVAECPPHHFVIESPSGTETSRGACRKCGQRRKYRNWLEQYEYAGTVWKKPR